jgi:hypothetical protein
MIDASLSALTKAWVTTMITVVLLCVALKLEQVWSTAVYMRTLPDALRLVGDGPQPVIDRWN